MGHERVGTLPKSKQWRQIVQGMSASYVNPTLVSSVATDTLGLVKGQLKVAQNEATVREAFGFLVRLSVAARSNQVGALAGKANESDPSTLALAIALRRHVADLDGNAEYKVIAVDAAIDALGRWHTQERHSSTANLFAEDGLAESSWHRLGNGEGFSEISRLFFSSFTERYLNFYLGREVGSALPNLAARRAFESEIARHAFESAKITQSFAAAWFKKHATDRDPTPKEVRGFVAHALGKMRDELNREGSR